VLALVAVLAACDDTTTVPAPELPPQISTTQSYAKGSTGLPNGDVYAMLTLSNGEFWIGTEQGIARYASIDATKRIAGDDGVINELNGLPNPKVRDMAELNSKVYVATWGGGFGIYDIAGGTWTSRNVVNGLRNSSIADIAVSTDENKVYLATNDGVSIYDPTADTFSSFVTLTRPVVSAVAVRNSTGGFERWYGPRVETIEDDPPPPMPAAGITVSRGSSTVYTYTMVTSGLPEPNVTAIFYDSDAGTDIFWVGTANKGVSRVAVDASTWATYTTVQGLPSNTVYAITRAAAPGGGTTIWVATQNGVARLEGTGTWQGYNTSGGLASDRVRKVYSDDGQHLWIGYINGGAARLNPTSAK
jgi:ligand-binding sensor domain-containing protein